MKTRRFQRVFDAPERIRTSDLRFRRGPRQVRFGAVEPNPRVVVPLIPGHFCGVGDLVRDPEPTGWTRSDGTWVRCPRKGQNRPFAPLASDRRRCPVPPGPARVKRRALRRAEETVTDVTWRRRITKTVLRLPVSKLPDEAEPLASGGLAAQAVDHALQPALARPHADVARPADERRAGEERDDPRLEREPPSPAGGSAS
jgi:hypothetical protein